MIKVPLTVNVRARTRLVRLEADETLIRTETLEGREFLVAPVVPIVEGVHNGEFLSYEEIAVFPEAWDGIPLPIDHPSDSNGNPVTANSPDVIENDVIGRLFNVAEAPDIRGIRGELWIDIEKAEQSDAGKEVLRKLREGEQLEVSTAYFTFTDGVEGEWKGEPFTASQSVVRPDHLALLPFDLGACSWQDGCGAPRVNQFGDSMTKKEDNKTVESNDKEIINRMTVNGQFLGSALQIALQNHSDRPGIEARLQAALGIDDLQLNALVNGESDMVPRQWLSVAAAVLDIDQFDLMMYASEDSYRAVRSASSDAANSSEEANATNSDNPKPCSCQQQKQAENNEEGIRALILKVIRSFASNGDDDDADEAATQENDMTKSERVDALVASERTQFSELHREALLAMDDDALEALVPQEAAAANVDDSGDSGEQAAAANADEAASEQTDSDDDKESAAPVALSREQLMEILGVSDDELAAIRKTSDSAKTARNSLIDELAANEDCPLSREGLASLSDDDLRNLKQDAAKRAESEPFGIRVRAAQRQDETPGLVESPAILLGNLRD